jgi:hypothetical protein
VDGRKKIRGLAGQPIIGRLQGHGPAPYWFRADHDLSYYVRILTTDGVRTLWGKDLERAVRAGATKPQVGDMIGARRTVREAITLINRQRDAQGRVTTQSEQHAHRFRWEVEKLQFFAERARRARLARDAQIETRKAIKQRPELRSTFVSLRAAEQLAERRIPNPQDREKFLSMVREAMDASTRRGEPIPDIPLRQKKQRERPNPAPQKRTREDPTR